jgi:hypothetical protein
VSPSSHLRSRSRRVIIICRPVHDWLCWLG